MPSTREFNEALDRMSDDEFNARRSKFGTDLSDKNRDYFKNRFETERDHDRDQWCIMFGLPRDMDERIEATKTSAEAALRSARIAEESLEVARVSAQAAQESAEAANAMARIAEEALGLSKISAEAARKSADSAETMARLAVEANASAKKTARIAVVATGVAIITGLITVVNEIRKAWSM
jgi:hypothetical protein